MLSGLLLVTAALPARADLSLVQIVQSQTSGGESGIFGKTWVQVSGRKMRLVSGYARKATKKKQKGPVRLIQLVDLDKEAATLLDPKSRTYETLPLGEIRYAGSLDRSRRQRPSFHIRSSKIEVERGRLDREVGDAWWGHYRVGVRMTLASAREGDAEARMEQDLWMAPLKGELQEGLLDLVAFENEYRKRTGEPFGPLDYGTYQMREVAAYLSVPESEIRMLLSQVRQAFPVVPGHPLSTSISWWKGAARKPASEPREREAPPVRQKLRPIPAFYAVKPRFEPIDFGGSWRLIDRILDAGDEERPAPSRRRRYPDYLRFQEEVRKAAGEAEPADDRRPSVPPPSGKPEEPVARPFYQTNTELDAFSFFDEIPAADFAVPEGYKPVSR